MIRSLFACILSVAPLVPAVCSAEQLIPKDLQQYLDAPEEHSGWEKVNHGNLANCDYWHLKLRSQTWQGIPWEHDLVVFRPAAVLPGEKMLLINEGGRFQPDKLMFGATLANLSKAPLAILLGVPNQPLLDGKTEDHLIAETFVRFLDSGDSSWPLLFPMVKSVVKGMDALQEFTAGEWEQQTKGFIIAGASKRGWTAWLTAAGDPRVTAIAPMVIDMLNIPSQLPLQVSRLGGFSEMISPYTERQLVPMHDTDEARALWTMVDPWTYRAKFTMPKLVLLGNNDPYWTTDALNVYWDGLPGEKYISYTPNAGHNLSEKNADGQRALPMRAINNVCAFVRCHISGKALPEISWEHGECPEGDMQLRVKADPMPEDVQLWVAKSASEDFRNARWDSRPVEVGENGIVTTVERPGEGFIAFYADLGYMFEDLPLRLCTQLRLEGAKE